MLSSVEFCKNIEAEIEKIELLRRCLETELLNFLV
jgi:hypothetical protein